MGMIDARGRWSRWDKKNTTDDYDQLDMQKFAALVDLATPCFGSWQWTRTNFFGEQKSSISYSVEPGRGVRLRYKSDKQDHDYLVRVVTTTPHYGGVRYWWLCPNCGRRVRILYGGKYFLCRKCHGLTYATSQASKGDYRERTRNRLWAIRRKLNAPGSIEDALPHKQKWMHHQTYWRLFAQYYRLKEFLQIAWTLEAVRLIGTVGNLDEETINLCAENIPDAWQELKQGGKTGQHALDEFARRLARNLPDDEPATVDHASRFTLGELASLANVPYAFAVEAQGAGLLRADPGRGKRRKRYRARLKSWLQKLHQLRQAGLDWADIRAWTQRRFKPGYEHERVWPSALQGLQR